MSQLGDNGRSIPPWSVLLPGYLCRPSCSDRSVCLLGPLSLPVGSKAVIQPSCPFCGCILGAAVNHVGLFVVVSCLLWSNVLASSWLFPLCRGNQSSCLVDDSCCGYILSAFHQSKLLPVCWLLTSSMLH